MCGVQLKFQKGLAESEASVVAARRAAARAQAGATAALERALEVSRRAR